VEILQLGFGRGLKTPRQKESSVLHWRALSCLHGTDFRVQYKAWGEGAAGMEYLLK
jgi:hypothetical protein